MRHERLPSFYPDAYRIGQDAVARIHLDMAEEQMASAAPDAFDRGYQNDKWRAMKRRLFAKARADHDRAKGVLEYLETMQ